MKVSATHVFFFHGLWSGLSAILLYRTFITGYGYDLMQIQCMTLALLMAWLGGSWLATFLVDRYGASSWIQQRWLGWMGWMGWIAIALILPWLPQWSINLPLQDGLSSLWPIRLLQVAILTALLLLPATWVATGVERALHRGGSWWIEPAFAARYFLGAACAVALGYGVLWPFWGQMGLVGPLILGATLTVWLPLQRPLQDNPSAEVRDESTSSSIVLGGLWFGLGMSLLGQLCLWQRLLQNLIGPFPWLGIVIAVCALLGLATGLVLQGWRGLGQQQRWISQAESWLILGMLGTLQLWAYPLLTDWLYRIVRFESLHWMNWAATLLAMVVMIIVPSSLLYGQILATCLTDSIPTPKPWRQPLWALQVCSVGAIIGGGLHPVLLHLGVALQLQQQILTGLQTGLGLILLANRFAWIKAWRLFVTLTCGLIMVLLLGWMPVWNGAKWAYGLYQPSVAQFHEQDERALDATRYQYQDGVFATIGQESQMDTYWRKRNGWIMPTNQLGLDSSNIIGLLSFLFAPHAAHIAQVSYGDMAPIPLFEHRLTTHIDLIIPEPQAFTQPLSHDPSWQVLAYNDIQISTFISQPQLFFAWQQAQYDSILLQLPPPWTDDAMELATPAFWQQLRNNLAEKGVVIAWLPGGENHPEFFQQQVCLFQDIFPQTLLLSAESELSDAILIGSQHPLHQSWQTWQQRSQPMSAYVASYGVPSLAGLFAQLRLDSTLLQPLCQPIPRPVRSHVLHAPQWFSHLMEHAKSLPVLPWLEPSQPQTLEVAQRLAQMEQPQELLHLIDGYLDQGMLEQVRWILQSYTPQSSEQLAMDPSFVIWQEKQQLLQLLEQAQDLESPSIGAWLSQDGELIDLQEAFVQQQFNTLVTFFEKRPNFTKRHGSRQLIYGYSLYRLGFAEQAEIVFQQAMYSTDDNALLRVMYYFHAKSAFQAGHLRQAVQSIQAYRSQQANTEHVDSILEQPSDQEQ